MSPSSVFEAWLFEARVQAFLCGVDTQVKDSRLSGDVVHGPLSAAKRPVTVSAYAAAALPRSARHF